MPLPKPLPPISLHASIEHDLLVEATDPPGPYIAPKPVKSVPPATRELMAGDAKLVKAVGQAKRKADAAKRAAAKAAKIAAAAVVAESKFATELATLDRIAAVSNVGFQHVFAKDVAWRLRSGRSERLSDAQRNIIARLAAEFGVA